MAWYAGGQAEYAAKYRQAVEKLVADRYLLPEDGVKLAEAAKLSNQSRALP